MKKLFILFICFLFFSANVVQAQTLQAGISIENVPKALYGNWRVSAIQDTTNAPHTFKPQGLDFWTLTRIGDTLSLENPQSGAKATVSLKTVEGNLISFTKTATYNENKKLTDTVTLRLEGNKFSGVNYIKLESFSLVDNHLMKTETATYLIKGEKISGDNILAN